MTPPTDYAARNAAPFIHPGETVLPADYPVNYGYAYVVETTDGEVYVTSSNVRGSVATLISDVEHWKPAKKVRHIRRCDLSARNLFGGT